MSLTVMTGSGIQRALSMGTEVTSGPYFLPTDGGVGGGHDREEYRQAVQLDSWAKGSQAGKAGVRDCGGAHHPT